MRTSIGFLEEAPDFRVLSETTFEFNFNEHRGGNLTETRPEKVFAYNVEWSVKLYWIDKGWGDFYYQYRTEGVPSFPTGTGRISETSKEQVAEGHHFFRVNKMTPIQIWEEVKKEILTEDFPEEVFKKTKDFVLGSQYKIDGGCLYIEVLASRNLGTRMVLDEDYLYTSTYVNPPIPTGSGGYQFSESWELRGIPMWERGDEPHSPQPPATDGRFEFWYEVNKWGKVFQAP